MLWRQSLLTNSGQAGFIIICSTIILNSLNKVLQDKSFLSETQGKRQHNAKQMVMKDFPTAVKELEEVKEITRMHCRQIKK